MMESGESNEIKVKMENFMTLSTFQDTWPFFSFFILYTVGRIPWAGDQPVARPLLTHRINADIDVKSCIRNHDPQYSSER
jgi:hypothetical protein